MTVVPNFETSGLLVFSPDATVTRLYRKAIDAIASRDLFVSHWCWRRLGSQAIASLYSANRKREPSSPLHPLVDELFDLDFSLVCVVDAQKDFPHGESVISFLRQFKGNSDPSQCDESSLRGLLNAPNKIMNYLHTSDSPESAEQEFYLLSTEEDEYFSHNLDLVISETEPEDLGCEVAVGAVYRLSKLKREFARSFDSSMLAPLNLLLSEENELARVVHRSPKQRARLSANIESQKRIQEELTNDRIDLSLLTLLLEEPGLWDFPAILSSAAISGVSLDRWDELSLRCQAYQKVLM